MEMHKYRKRLFEKVLDSNVKIILPETVHGGIFGKNWYCTSSKVRQWWKQIHWK